MARATKTVPGHKRARVRFIVQVECECGWTSANWVGKGASAQAHNEWRWHRDDAHTKQAGHAAGGGR
jgi:hypothetical protein